MITTVAWPYEVEPTAGIKVTLGFGGREIGHIVSVDTQARQATLDLEDEIVSGLLAGTVDASAFIAVEPLT